MKIIKRGKDPEDTPWRGTCPNCHSVMRAQVKELRDRAYDQREDAWFAKATCPVCKWPDVNFYPEARGCHED